MKCEKATEIIDRMVFESSIRTDPLLQSHIESCSSCKAYYDDSMNHSSIIRSLQKNEPVLQDANGLADIIMEAVSNVTSSEQNPIKSSRAISMAVRLLAAATVSLFIVLGIEQYMVLDKIQTLESRLENTSPKRTLLSQDYFAYQLLNSRPSEGGYSLEFIDNIHKGGLRQKILVARLSSTKYRRYAQYSKFLSEEQIKFIQTVNQAN
jgi:hypothetical protein